MGAQESWRYHFGFRQSRGRNHGGHMVIGNATAKGDGLIAFDPGQTLPSLIANGFLSRLIRWKNQRMSAQA